MASTNPVPWQRDPHTAAKHAVYRQYLTKWWPIMLRGFGGDVTYAEGFSGPGVYLGGEPGSPVIALKTLLADQSLRGVVKTARLLFVDHDKRCVGMLEERLTAAAPKNFNFERLRNYGIDIAIEHGSCEPKLEAVLDAHGAWHHPILMVLDTWGGAVSASLLQRVAANKGSEVIVTFQPQYFSRFATVDDMPHGDRVFGDTAWREVAKQPPGNKTIWLRDQYRQTVAKAGFRYVLDFELVSADSQVLYLVFGTTHPLGLKKMKEAMWEVDSIRGSGYRDPRDPDQQVLAIEIEPATAPLRRLILRHLATLPDKSTRIIELRRFALFETVFKESQAHQVVLSMLEAGQLVSVNPNERPTLGSVVRLP